MRCSFTLTVEGNEAEATKAASVIEHTLEAHLVPQLAAEQPRLRLDLRVSSTSDRHSHWFRDDRARAQAHRYLPGLAAAGLSPAILELTETRVVTRRGRPLREWWPRADAAARARMRTRVLRLIEQLHARGICHRDLHDRNLILGAGDQPQVIDVEWACDVDPAAPCYDLCGPASGVPVPATHLSSGAPFARGVCWGNPLAGSGYTSLGEIFGPLPPIAPPFS